MLAEDVLLLAELRDVFAEVDWILWLPVWPPVDLLTEDDRVCCPPVGLPEDVLVLDVDWILCEDELVRELDTLLLAPDDWDLLLTLPLPN